MVKRLFFGVKMAQIFTENQKPISFKGFYGSFREKSMKNGPKGPNLVTQEPKKLYFPILTPKSTKIVRHSLHFRPINTYEKLFYAIYGWKQVSKSFEILVRRGPNKVTILTQKIFFPKIDPGGPTKNFYMNYY